LDHITLEGLVEDLYGRAGASPDDVWSPSKLARKLGVRVVEVPGMLERGKLSRLGDAPLIAIRARLPLEIGEWTIGHELGHLAGLDAEEERACDYVGAAIQMRRRPFLRALHEHRDAWHELAERFETTSTSAALRAAELEERALAVITPARVYPRAIYLPDHEIRRIARVGGPGIVRARLVDDRRRIVVEAREVEG
jgi:hypothetical protein